MDHYCTTTNYQCIRKLKELTAAVVRIHEESELFRTWDHVTYKVVVLKTMNSCLIVFSLPITSKTNGSEAIWFFLYSEYRNTKTTHGLMLSSTERLITKLALLL